MTVNVDRIVDVSIERASRTLSRRGFGTLLVAGFHEAYLDRVRSYASPEEITADGLPELHPIVLAARAAFAQTPSPKSIKVGRRVGAPTQLIRLTPVRTDTGFEYVITIAGVEITVTVQSGDAVADIIDDLVTAIAASTLAADTDAIMLSTATAASTQTFDTAAELAGVIGLDEMTPPRKITVTRSAHADQDAVTAVLVYLDQYGNTVTENLAFANGGGDSFTSAKPASQFVSLTIPAQAGTGGTTQIGVTARVTTTDNTTSLDVTGSVAGEWDAYDLNGIASADLLFEDRTAVPGTTLATDLDAMQAADPDWYGLVVADAQSSAQILAIGAWASTETVLVCADTMDTIVEQDTDTDVASDLKELSRLRIWPFYSRVNHGAFPAAAIMGRMLPLDPGSADFEFKTLEGIEADDLSTTVLDRLIGTPTSPTSGKRAMVYMEVVATGTASGIPITMGGLTAGAEWIDVVQGLDFVEAKLQEVAFNVRVAAPRLPYTTAGIDSLEGAVRAALFECARRPYEILDPDTITTEATPLADVPPADKAARYYDGIRFDAQVQGAIRAMKFRGTVRP